MPADDVAVPPTTLTIPWSSEIIRLTPPVVIPYEVIRKGYPAWAKDGGSANWSFHLPDGRIVAMLAARFETPQGPRFGVSAVSVFSPKATLQMQIQNNEVAGAPAPNHPKSWTTYERDGKTLAAEIVCFQPPFTGWHVTLYQNGKPSRQFQVNHSTIEIEYQINADGTQKETDASREYNAAHQTIPPVTTGPAPR